MRKKRPNLNDTSVIKEYDIEKSRYKRTWAVVKFKGSWTKVAKNIKNKREAEKIAEKLKKVI